MSKKVARLSLLGIIIYLGCSYFSGAWLRNDQLLAPDALGSICAGFLLLTLALGALIVCLFAIGLASYGLYLLVRRAI
jgi:hypothetical protein